MSRDRTEWRAELVLVPWRAVEGFAEEPAIVKKESVHHLFELINNKPI